MSVIHPVALATPVVPLSVPVVRPFSTSGDETLMRRQLFKQASLRLKKQRRELEEKENALRQRQQESSAGASSSSDSSEHHTASSSAPASGSRTGTDAVGNPTGTPGGASSSSSNSQSSPNNRIPPAIPVDMEPGVEQRTEARKISLRYAVERQGWLTQRLYYQELASKQPNPLKKINLLRQAELAKQKQHECEVNRRTALFVTANGGMAPEFLDLRHFSTDYEILAFLDHRFRELCKDDRKRVKAITSSHHTTETQKQEKQSNANKGTSPTFNASREFLCLVPAQDSTEKAVEVFCDWIGLDFSKGPTSEKSGERNACEEGMASSSCEEESMAQHSDTENQYTSYRIRLKLATDL